MVQKPWLPRPAAAGAAACAVPAGARLMQRQGAGQGTKSAWCAICVTLGRSWRAIIALPALGHDGATKQIEEFRTHCLINGAVPYDAFNVE